MSTNWADRKGTTPGSDKAVKLQKAIAMGASAPETKRVVRVPGLAGGEGGGVKVPGFSNRQ
jgi:hypothetical protein